MEEDLRAFLLADVAVGALISTRMHPLALPQNVTMPAVSYSEVSAIRNYHMQGQDRLAFVRMQIDAWGETFAAARGLANAIRDSIGGYQGYLDGSPSTYAEGIFFETERTTYESEPELYRVSADYTVTFRE